ncbi:putative methionyl-tRNA synthetase [Hordeum vulgare]|nr:putative methionyl-tRNA synthetase [Hordeum vulgare]
MPTVRRLKFVMSPCALPTCFVHRLVHMLLMFTMYRTDNKDQEFRFLHVFSRIDSCEKWREVRLALDKAKETYNPNVHAPAAVEGRPQGTKKDRAARDAAPAANG